MAEKAKQSSKDDAENQNGQPGIESTMKHRPKAVDTNYRASGKLEGKKVIITGGDSGIGRAVAVLFAREGADVAIVYLPREEVDAKEVAKLVGEEGRKCLLLPGDVGDEKFCQSAIEETVKKLGGLDILVNNAAEQHPQDNLEDITAEQLEKTFRTNIFGYFFMAKAALKHLKKGSAIVNTTSVTAYAGAPNLLDYSSTKGAIVSFTRSLSGQLAKKGIRVNGVAPGPIWTPLIPATMPEIPAEEYGTQTPLGRAGQPEEVAKSYLFLACEDASYISGQVIHVNGGEIVNG